MDRSVKLGTTSPEGDANGLADPEVIRALMDHPMEMRVGIIIFNVPKSATDHDKGTVVGAAVVRRIEVVVDDTLGDASALQRLLMRAYERRTGTTTLDTELEDDVRAAFDNLKIEQVDESQAPGGTDDTGGDE